MKKKIIKIENKEAIEYANGISEDIFSSEWQEAYENKVKEISTKNPRL